MKKLSERRGRGKSPGGGIHIQGEKKRWFTLMWFQCPSNESPCNVKTNTHGRQPPAAPD